MKFYKLLPPWLPALLVLGGCLGTEPMKPPHLLAVFVSCSPNPVTVGGTSTCTASAIDEYGQPFTVSGYTWSSSHTDVATVDAQGVATSTAVGTAALSASATADGVAQQGLTVLSVSAKPATLHSAPITQSETWRAVDNPHLVRGQLTVDSGATLTLEPGADVRFEPDAELRVRDGALQAEGTAQAGIQLSGNELPFTRSTWRGVVLASNKSVSKWSFVTLYSCGQATGEQACLTLLNQAAPVLQDVSVNYSGGVGVKVADDGSAFGAGSARLTVTHSAGYAMSLGANQASTLPPASAFVFNEPEAIELNGNVTRTQTWPTASVPYVFNGPTYVLGPNAATTTTLTLSPRTVLRFGPKAAFIVGKNDSVPEASATLIAEGTAADPIFFIADSNHHGPGSWQGLHFAYYSKSSRLSHVTVKYAGAMDPSSVTKDSYLNGNLNLYGAPPPYENLTVSDVILENGSGPGLYVGGGALGTGSARLTLRENGEHAVRVTPEFAYSIPTDTVFVDNASNDVAIGKYGGGSSQIELSSSTWHKLSVPYFIENLIGVDNGKTLTIEAGTELRFAPNGGIRVGFLGSSPAGVLLAQGTAANPIRFIRAYDSPVYNWGGLHLWYADGSKLDHVVVSHGGGLGATADPSTGVYGDGCINFYREIGPVLTNSALDNALGGAINGSKGSRPNTTQVTTQYFDAQYNNTSTNSGVDGQTTTL